MFWFWVNIFEIEHQSSHINSISRSSEHWLLFLKLLYYNVIYYVDSFQKMYFFIFFFYSNIMFVSTRMYMSHALKLLANYSFFLPQAINTILIFWFTSVSVLSGSVSNLNGCYWNNSGHHFMYISVWICFNKIKYL